MSGLIGQSNLKYGLGFTTLNVGKTAPNKKDSVGSHPGLFQYHLRYIIQS